MSSASDSILARATITVLKPLLRVLIRHKVSHAEFAELARQAYVDVAYEHFGIPGRKLTYSRVAVVTGLSRKEVQRLAALREANELAVKSSPNRALRVVNGWLGDDDFLDDNDTPRTLPLQGETGSFAALVARYSGDITAGAVLDELKAMGLVESPDKRSVRLTDTGYIPREDDLEKIRIFAMSTADLMDTAIHNLEHPPEQARLQRQLVYPRVPDSIAEEIRIQSTRMAASLLQELNRFLAKRLRSSDSVNDSGPGKRLGLGIYYFENDSISEDSDDEDQTSH